MKYRVYGHTTVTVVIDVNADSEAEAYETAFDQRPGLDAYCGNGGTDKIIGVSGENVSVAADEEIEYDDIELIGPEQKCRVCGCTEDNACPGGCWWVEEDLCSECAGRETDNEL